MITALLDFLGLSQEKSNNYYKQTKKDKKTSINDEFIEVENPTYEVKEFEEVLDNNEIVKTKIEIIPIDKNLAKRKITKKIILEKEYFIRK